MQFPSDRIRSIRSTETKDLASLMRTVKSIEIDASLKNAELLNDLPSITSIVYSGQSLPRPLANAISSAPNLDFLILLGVRELKHPLKSASLKTVHLRACSGLQDFGFLKGCPAVHEIWTLGCRQLSSLRGLERLGKLELLEVQGTSSIGTIETLKPLKKLSRLVMLSLASRVSDKSLTGIASPELERLWLDNFFTEAEYHGVLKRCPKLKRIELHNGVFTRERGFKKDKD